MPSADTLLTGPRAERARPPALAAHSRGSEPGGWRDFRARNQCFQPVAVDFPGNPRASRAGRFQHVLCVLSAEKTSPLRRSPRQHAFPARISPTARRALPLPASRRLEVHGTYAAGLPLIGTKIERNRQIGKILPHVPPPGVLRRSPPWGEPLLPTAAPLPALGYPFLVLTFVGWIWRLFKPAV